MESDARPGVPQDADDLAGRLRDAFDDRVHPRARSAKRLYADVATGDLVRVVHWLRASVPGLRLATSTVLDQRDGVAVFHHFAINGRPLVVTLKVLARKPDPVLPSLAPFLSAANWIEREMHDMTGVAFDGHPDLRRLVKAAAFPHVHPLRRNFDTTSFKESIGERLDF